MDLLIKGKDRPINLCVINILVGEKSSVAYGNVTKFVAGTREEC